MVTLPTHQDFEILAVHADMSIAAACRAAGVSPEVFSRWKRGVSSPTLAVLERVAAVLRLGVERKARLRGCELAKSGKDTG
jgi:transcriptional regulator with XRE-family HTH domain